MKNKLYEARLRKVLTLLEASVDGDVATIERVVEVVAEVKALAQKHVVNQKKIDDLQEQIDALLAQQEKYQDKNSIIEEDIKKMIGETKSQSFRFGKILVDFQYKLVKGVTRSNPQYKAIVEDLKMTYGIEEKIISDLCLKYNNGNKPFEKPETSLSITKESVQLKEGIKDVLQKVWIGFKGVFSRLFKSYVHSITDLEQRVAQL